ncbi:MAG: hypothetical protein KatS3mg060_2757 [Dehalococcoidia bacterium]|nr:MAG: hypothetical protein KatS3mg060_2757 [Dehalococcoidia bacterium]
MARIRLKAVAGALGAVAALAAPLVLGPMSASAQQPSVPQFGAANTLEWPPVFSGEIQATIGNATVILGLVGNRTLREHAFVDVRWAISRPVSGSSILMPMSPAAIAGSLSVSPQPFSKWVG